MEQQQQQDHLDPQGRKVGCKVVQVSHGLKSSSTPFFAVSEGRSSFSQRVKGHCESEDVKYQGLSDRHRKGLGARTRPRPRPWSQRGNKESFLPI
jgi:hypothetical protein